MPCKNTATVTLAWASPAMPGLAFWRVCAAHADELQSDFESRSGYTVERMATQPEPVECRIITPLSR